MIRLKFASAREVFDAYTMAASDIQAAPTEEAPLVYLDGLLGSKAPEDAISFCAYALGRREAVWWASQSVRSFGGPRNHDEEKALLIAEAWVREPEEHRRRAALDVGFNGDRAFPGVWVSLAAGTAGGTLTVGGTAGPPCPPDMTARSARAAVLIALSSVPARERSGQIRNSAEIFRRLAQAGDGAA